MCEEQGGGVYAYKTGTMIEIVEQGGGRHTHRVFQAGKPIRTGEWDVHLDDPMILAMWVEIGCPTPRQMGFASFCETDAIREAFDNTFKGVDHNRFVRDKLTYHAGDDWKPCRGEDDNPTCERGCGIQDFVESAAKRSVTVNQIMRDGDCRCRKCRVFGI